jgi:glycosyltransferase involved in cell wall biosynthesis
LGGVSPDILARIGFPTLYLPIDRDGTNPVQELRCFFSTLRLFRQIRPDLLHLVTIKPYLYGGVAARLARVRSVVSAVAGLGGLFVRLDWKSRLLRTLLYPAFRFAFGHPNQCVIVQNSSDASHLVSWGVLDSKKIELVRGSGVDLSLFTKLDDPGGVPIVCFASRLLRDKGVYDFISAAVLLRRRGITVRFWLAGAPDPKNSASLTDIDLRALADLGVVEVLGYQEDIPNLFAQSHIVCLPSFYGEGIPKVLIEAAAASKAIVTTDHPGCRDAVIPGKSGLLVPIRDPEKLADALQWLVEHPCERVAMGKVGRLLAEQEFSIEKIVRQHMSIYNELLSGVAH